MIEIHTPNYIAEPIRQQYAATILEDLLPEIAFPIENIAREIAQDIQQINADMQQQLLGRKSSVSTATSSEQASNTFTELYAKIIEEGTRNLIEKEIEKAIAKGKNSEGILLQVQGALERYQNTTIPQKVDLLFNHFNGKLSEIQQREAGITHYIWRSQDDDKVRGHHASNDDQIFAWDNPPQGGHPGEDYNCRCYAEPFSSEGVEEVAIEDILGLAAVAKKLVAKGTLKIFKNIKKVFRNPISRRPENVPKDWKKVPSDKKEGYKYTDPKNKHNDVRVQKGDPKSQYPNSKNDYVRWKKDGKWLDKNGNPVNGKKDPNGHIPIDEFKFDKDLFR